MICDTGIGLTGTDFATPMVSRQGKQTFTLYNALNERTMDKDKKKALENIKENNEDDEQELTTLLNNQSQALLHQSNFQQDPYAKGKSEELVRKMDMLSSGQQPLFNQFYHFMGLKDMVGNLFLNSNVNQRNKSMQQKDSKNRKSKQKKVGKSMCFQSVGRENTMVQIHERMKLNVECKYNPVFSQIEKQAHSYSFKQQQHSPSRNQLQQIESDQKAPCQKLTKIYANNRYQTQNDSQVTQLARDYSQSIHKFSMLSQNTLREDNQGQTEENNNRFNQSVNISIKNAGGHNSLSKSVDYKSKFNPTTASRNMNTKDTTNPTQFTQESEQIRISNNGKHNHNQSSVLQSQHSIINYNNDYLAFMTEVPGINSNNYPQVKSKLVAIDKLIGREQTSFLNERMNAGPNENRFLNINKSPEILSTVRRIGKVEISKQTGRKDDLVDKFKSDIYYDANYDSVQSTQSKVVPNFNKFTSRKELFMDSDFNGYIDNLKVAKQMDFISSFRKPKEPTLFDKQLARDYTFQTTATSTDYSLPTIEQLPILEKVGFSEYLPNSVAKRKLRMQMQERSRMSNSGNMNNQLNSSYQNGMQQYTQNLNKMEMGSETLKQPSGLKLLENKGISMSVSNNQSKRSKFYDLETRNQNQGLMSSKIDSQEQTQRLKEKDLEEAFDKIFKLKQKQ
eukprot:403367881